MKYFKSLPIIKQFDPNSNQYINAVNLTARGYMVPSLVDNLAFAYKYDVNEADTPENIAQRYYNDVNRYWIVLFGNNILDPQFGWPLTSSQFQSYLVNKYSAAANSTDPNIVLSYVTGTVDHYQKTVTTKNSDSLQSQTITIEIDSATFNSTPSMITSNFTLPSGETITQTVTTSVVSIYTNENNLNEAKRKINIVKDVYVPQMETQLQTLMKS
mgnify:FL=1